MENAMVAKQDVKRLYAGILAQAVTDLEHPNPAAKELTMRLEVEDFLRSDWGRSIMDVLDLDYTTVANRMNLAGKIEELHRFYRLVKLGRTDDAIAKEMALSPAKVALWRWDILGLRKHKGRKPDIAVEERQAKKAQRNREYQKEYYQRTKARQPLGL